MLRKQGEHAQPVSWGVCVGVGRETRVHSRLGAGMQLQGRGAYPGSVPNSLAASTSEN